jgi:hypothetical protein
MLQTIDAYCRNLNLGLMTKARACEGACEVWRLGVTFHVPRSVQKCEGMNLTLPSELPFWELESQWSPESSESDCRGQNRLDWWITYIIGNILERKCLKWVYMTHLGH